MFSLKDRKISVRKLGAGIHEQGGVEERFANN